MIPKNNTVVAVLLIFFVMGVGVGIIGARRLPVSRVLSIGISRCQNEPNRTAFIRCFRSYLSGRKPREGIRPFSDALDLAFAGSTSPAPQFTKYCHDIAHSLGQLAGETAATPTEALLSCTTVCGAGCYHGVVEASLRSGRELTESVTGFCSGVIQSATLSRSRWACFHGLGHGIAGVAGDFGKAISYCDRIPVDDDKKNCDRGVMMELFESSSFEHEKLRFPDNARDICGSLQGVHREVCFGNAGLEKYFQTQDLARAVAACETGPPEYTDVCIGLLGNTTYHESVGDIKQIIDVCHQTGHEIACIKGAVHEDVLTDPNVRVAERLCRNISAGLQEECTVYLRERVRSIHGKNL